ncbi:MAG TPA: Phosphoribosyl 1,2-cyclic phosphate phosphodiesterase [Hyphomicrobiaceae bacterium MAG_BT-2024]
MTLRCTILGCGASGGVPRIGHDWGACDQHNPKNHRRRCAALIEKLDMHGRTTSILIDAGPDIRTQMLTLSIDKVDAVLFTHDHADHTHGIDDLRFLAYRMQTIIQMWADESTCNSLRQRFGYCFDDSNVREYPPILKANSISSPEPFVVKGNAGFVQVTPILQRHGKINSLAYRIGNLAYSPDVSGFYDGVETTLSGLDVWIVDALRYRAHPNHFNVEQALEWIKILKPKRSILTHLNIELDYDTLSRELPSGVEPAYDGLTVSAT